MKAAARICFYPQKVSCPTAQKMLGYVPAVLVMISKQSEYRYHYCLNYCTVYVTNNLSNPQSSTDSELAARTVAEDI